MASWFIGINRGQLENPGLAVVSTATQAVDFEMRIDSGKSSTKWDAMKAMKLITEYIESNGLPAGKTGTFLPPN